MTHSPFPWSIHPQVRTGVYDADGMKVSASLGPNAEDNAALIAAIPAMIEALGLIRDYLEANDFDTASEMLIDHIDTVLASIGKKP